MNSSNEMLQKFLLFAFVIFITSRGVRPRSFVATRNVAEREAPFLHRLRRCHRAWGPSYPSSTTTSKHHLLSESPPALHPASTSSSLRYRASEMGSLPSLWTWIPLLVSMGGWPSKPHLPRACDPLLVCGVVSAGRTSLNPFLTLDLT